MTDWLLDTNVVSELARPSPNPGVTTLVAGLDRLVIGSIVLYELDRGVALLPSGRRKQALAQWLGHWLGDSVLVLPLDREAARAAARIEASASRRGRSIEVRDALLLGIASMAGLGVASRNIAHLAGHGVPTLDPFA
jgi:predicted nucleic acid-binding protein